MASIVEMEGPPEGVLEPRREEIQLAGQLETPAIESLLVGFLIRDPDIPRTEGWERRNAEAVEDAGIKGQWFEDKSLGGVFDFLMTIFKSKRDLLTAEEFAITRRASGLTKDKAAVEQAAIKGCATAVLAYPIRAKLLCDLVVNRRRLKVAHEEWRRLENDCKNDSVGPGKAIETFRKAVAEKLVPPGGGVLRKHPWVGDFDSTMTWLRDIKHHPERYRGHLCGIQAIDVRTRGGFRPGHLTVFVGKPGGYKTTTLLNVAYGLWQRGKNVLYVSLEMSARELQAKLWCRHAGIDYTHVLGGEISEPEDFDEYLSLSKRGGESPLSGDDKARMDKLKGSLKRAPGIAAVISSRDQTDLAIFAMARREMTTAKNDIMITASTLSSKMRISELERFLRENEATFQPDVVIVDYLALCSAEESHPDRRDLELGDICKYLRNLGEARGFSSITAAQLKRAALERIRKFGEGTPEKATVGTDDVADSHQIAADADTLFVLWPLGGSRLKIITPKARHGEIDQEGKILSIHDVYAMVVDEGTTVESLAERARKASLGGGKALMAEAAALTPDSEDVGGPDFFGGSDGAPLLDGDF